MTTHVSPETIARAVREYFMAIRAMDADAFAKSFAEDGRTFDPVGTPPVTGHAELRKFFQSICTHFKTVALDEDSVFIAGNGAAVKWTGHGTSQNGRAVKFEGIDVIEVNEEGMVRTVHAYWNPAGMISQL